MSMRSHRFATGSRVLAGLAAACLAGASWAFPLRLNNTQMRSVVEERVPGVRHVIVHRTQGAILNERDLVRNDTGKADARVHASLTQVGDDSYVLQLQAQDLGSADHYRLHVTLDVPNRVSCRGGYWTVADGNLLTDDLVSGAKPVYWWNLNDEIHVAYHRAQRAPMHFTGGQMQLYFRVIEACT